ncbi:hypothetical protein V2A60_007654 [Cordyceps javanica]|uniref:Mismatch-specific thymine-DNA glycosylase n=1 Tax=Cordyceps javanica TaxID=43265 RepID=A0A545VA93_9HYPO|nr:mismatch-specific thymine-DNA glycosylase [Cordyceps javanica]TQW09842.1 mismatch-specific thymine-DNA glycosylase [Cordyceps javanica]
MASADPDREPGPGDNASPPPQPSSFRGRLQLQDFMYQPGDAPVPRRSARHAAAAVAAASTIRGTTPSPRKRTLSASASSPSSSGVSKPAAVAAAGSRKKEKEKKTKTTTTTTTATAETTTTGKAKRKKRASSGYAPPSTYAHLPLLPDAVCEDLLVLFVGLNPGLQTARTGHAYAHPTNTFWKLLHTSGVTPRLCSPDEDRRLPALYGLGLTNIVARPSRNGAELSRAEMDDGVAALEAKARRWRPESVCVVGKSIWESIWRVRHGGRPVAARFRYGWQDPAENMGVVPGGGGGGGAWPGARVFVASSTSGLAATLSPAQKQAIWDELGAWVKVRRAERELEAERAAAAASA